MLTALLAAAFAPVVSGREVAPPPWPVEFGSAAAVRRLTPAQAAEGRPVKLVGVVTHVTPHWSDFFLQDGSAGIYVGGTPLAAGLKTGDRIELRGRTDPGDFAPCVRAVSVRVLAARAPLPEPYPFDLSQEESRWLDGQYTQVTGVLTGVDAGEGFTKLTVSRGERTGTVWVPGEKFAAMYRSALGTPLRVRGVCVPGFTVEDRRIVNPPRLYSQDPPALPLLSAAGPTQPLLPLGMLYRFSPGPSVGARWVRVRGVVVARTGASLVVQEGDAGATVEPAKASDAAVGTAVDVRGFVEFDGRRAVLKSAAVTPLGPGALPGALPINAADLESGLLEPVRVRVGGKVVAVTSFHGVLTVSLVMGRYRFDALLPDGVPPPAVGSEVVVQGAATAWHPDPNAGRRLSVFVAAPADVSVMAPPPPGVWWAGWTAEELGGAFIAVAAVALAATAWLVLLRRTVRRQTAAMTAAFARESQLQEQLRQAQKLEAVGRLAGGIAHDFNNLLTVINGCGELLCEQFPDGHPGKDLARDIRHAGDRAAGLTGQLLLFSRHRTVTPTAVDLNAVVADVVKLLARVIPENIAVVTEYVNLPPVRADVGLLHQVIVNLALNSRDAMPTGGTLGIRTALVDGGTGGRLVVEDTGTGMDADTQSRLYEPFFTTKEIGQGTGLGLATVYGIVQALGGTIRFVSAVGVGTTFEVDFAPAGSGKILRPPLPADSKSFPAFGRRGRILLVEDDDGVRLLARRVLESEGYTVTAAATPDAAVEATTRGDRFDLLLTDVVMPGMNGRELAERVLAVRPVVRVLFMSGYAPDEVLRQGVLADETAFLGKPFTPAQLLAKVAEVLGERSALDLPTPEPR